MEKNIEILRWEAQERALAQEIKSNPKTCLGCNLWQHGGDMSSALHHCTYCGSKEAKHDIKQLITRISVRENIPYEAAWDLTNQLLTRILEEHKRLAKTYFDEDHFYGDMIKHFKL